MQPDDDKTQAVTILSRGTVINHYRIVEKIGAGGMGEVYLAEDTELNRKVALKFLSTHLCQDADCRARFTREAQAAARLGHSNIVAVHEVGEHQGRPFFAMELVEGRSLDKIVAAGRLDEGEIVELAIGICNGLRKAHESGVIHRDIKPSNIIVDRDNVPRVLDFGLADIRDSEKLTQPGSTLGTIGYMSPEQVSGRGADARSDLFALGVVLYEMISGVNPFRRDNHAATLKAIVDDTPGPLADCGRKVSNGLQRVVGKLLEKRPEYRYQTAADIISDLKSLGTTDQSLNGNPARTNRLAVLPFQDLSNDPEQEYFSDGLTEELITTLSKVKSLCVISRSSVMTFKGSKKKLPEIADELNVQYVVEGSVRRSGRDLRITAQLIDATNDAHLWADRYSGTLDDVFEIQDNVTRAIVEGIRLQLSPSETRRLGKRSFVDATAYEKFLRSKEEIRKGTEDGINRGMQYLQQAAEIVGENALILCEMGGAHFIMVSNGFAQDESISKAEEYAQKALKLDSELPEAHSMLGWLNMAFLGNQRQAVDHFKRALSADADNEGALIGLATVCFGYVGKFAAAQELIQRYYATCPLNTRARFGLDAYMHFYAGDFPQALDMFRAVRLAGRKDPSNELYYSVTLALCDCIVEAHSVIDECAKANPRSSIISLLQLLRLALMKDKEGALLALTSDAQRTCMRDAQLSYHLGAVLARAGAANEALNWLENAVNKGFVHIPFMEKDTFLDSLRGDERFKKLMERVKYEWEKFEV